jgi:hypothetical protein
MNFMKKLIGIIAFVLFLGVNIYVGVDTETSDVNVKIDVMEADAYVHPERGGTCHYCGGNRVYIWCWTSGGGCWDTPCNYGYC